MLTSADLAVAIAAMSGRIGVIREELNAADRALGDGDTGMTVEQVVTAWMAVSDSLPQDVGAALVLLGRQAMRASGSSLGMVLGTGLVAAGRAVAGARQVERAAMAAAIGVAIDAICARGGASAGAKSILDSLIAIRSELGADRGMRSGVDAAAGAAAAALDEFRSRPSRIGRARVHAQKSIGLDDPGMLAVLRLLEAMRAGTGTGP